MKPSTALLVVVLASFITASALAAQRQQLRLDHVVVNYTAISEPQARSLADVANAARDATVKRFNFNVPETITINVDCDPANTVRLFTDGNDTFNLSIRTPADLAPPATSGIRNLYGMCHELGHVVMYRAIKDRRWMSGAAAEAWAHYFGSQVVDDVYAARGEKVWWMPYDYRADGMSRLRSQLRESAPTEEARLAGAWMELAHIVGEKNIPALFAGWGKAKVDHADPSPAVLAALRQTSSDARIDAWWQKTSPALIVAMPMSPFAAPAPAATKPDAATKPALSGKATELALDDGKSAGQSSIAGSGHAVLFEAHPEGTVVTAVKIYGARYGRPEPPAEDFHVWLCDADGKQIKEFAFPYKLFLCGALRWVTLKLPEPAEVPTNFIVCVGFNPQQTKGVFVHYDKAVDGDSRTGLPGQINDAFGKGDWMIRAVVTPKP